MLETIPPCTVVLSFPFQRHGQGSLASYSPWGSKESDTTEHAHNLLKRLQLLSPSFIVTAGRSLV